MKATLGKVIGIILVLALLPLVAAAATSYITPWYANPALRSRTYVNANAFTPVDLKVGADGERVVVVTSGGAAAPLGKALVIFRKSRFDAPATVFIVR